MPENIEDDDDDDDGLEDGPDDSASETSSLVGQSRSRSPFRFGGSGSRPTSRKSSPVRDSRAASHAEKEGAGFFDRAGDAIGGLFGQKRRSSLRGDYRSVGGSSTGTQG